MNSQLTNIVKNLVSIHIILASVVNAQNFSYDNSFDFNVSLHDLDRGAPGAAIVGGYTAPNRPFYVAINSIGYCGGSIVSSTVVVTAAHCVVDLKQRSVYVYYGDFTKGGKIYKTYGDWKVHPSYNPKSTSSANDIAVIKLRSRISSSYAISMCKSSYSKYPIAVCGMGKIDGRPLGPESKYLMEVQLHESASGKGCYDMTSTKKTNLSDGQQKRQLQWRLGRSHLPPRQPRSTHLSIRGCQLWV